MFSFISRWFGKGKKKDDEEEEEVKPWKKGDPIPYSTNFIGAVKVEVFARDCSRENITAVGHTFVRPAEIALIVRLLKSLAGAGTQQLKTDECVEHTLTAYNKDDIPFAQVKFYNGHLLDENQLFVGSGANDRLLNKQAELYELIRISLH